MDHSKPPRAAHLSATQRECLRLVELGKSSDEIAGILNISRAAVVQRLVGARKAQDPSRRDQATLLYEHASAAQDRTMGDPAVAPLNRDLRPGGNPQDSIFDETSIDYDFDVEHELTGAPMSAVDAEGSWSTAKKIAIIVILTIGTLAIALIGLSVSQSVSGLFTG